MSAPPEHPYAHFLDRVMKPSRYVGGEHGEVIKEWEAVTSRICLAFPDVYEIGMSHLGFKILYSLINGHDKLLAERAYAPWSDMEQELRSRELPLVSLESAKALKDFDVVGFSLQFELTFTNILLMLELGGIPLRSEERGEEDPLVIAGGPTATHAEPIAPFLDVLVIGDGEEKAPEIMLTWAALKRAGMPRRERLAQLAALGGVYVPSLYETELEPQTGMQVVSRARVPEAPLPVERAMVGDLNDYPFPSGGPVASTETVFDRVSVEIARGCTEGCRFCQAGMIYRPVRERDPASVLDTIQRAVREGGYDEASLTCLSTADYSAIHPLVKAVMERFEKEKISLSVSSLRAYGLDPELLDELKKMRATGLTFAPEAGTQRMRDVVNKNVTEEQLMETARRVFSRGWSKMKLYFMIGLPTEEEEDVLGIVETGKKAQDLGRRLQKGRGPSVTVSVSIHVPKPHTPFQWCAMDPRERVQEKQGLLREQAREKRIKLRMHDSEGSWLEGVIARGDRRLADVIEAAYHKGARFDSWEERFSPEAWAEAFEEVGVDPAPFLRTLPLSARLPWDHIDVGLEEGFLEREYKKALKNRLSPPCGKAAGMFVHHTNLAEAEADRRRLVCYDCGVACDMSQMREERLVYLRTLGATDPPPKIEEDWTGPVIPKHRVPTPTLAQGEPMRLRLQFRKLGRAAYRGHLDLVRVLPRIFRRVGLPLYYSRGFRPKPEMVFSPALPLGIASLSEYLDLKLDSAVDYDYASLIERLRDKSEPGIEFLWAGELVNGDPRITRVIDAAEYVLGVPRRELAERGLVSVEAMNERIARQRAGAEEGSLVVIRPPKDGKAGIGKKVNVAHFLLEVAPGEGEEALKEAGVLGDLVPIRLALRLPGSGSARVGEALEALLGEKGLSLRAVRTELFALKEEEHGTERVQPTELLRLRKHPAPSAGAISPAKSAPAAI